MAANEDNVYLHRLESGLYDDTIDQLADLPLGTALALSTYQEDFLRTFVVARSNAKGNFYPGSSTEISTLSEINEKDKEELDHTNKWTTHASGDTTITLDLINVTSDVVPKSNTSLDWSPAKKAKVVKRSLAREAYNNDQAGPSHTSISDPNLAPSMSTALAVPEASPDSTTTRVGVSADYVGFIAILSISTDSAQVYQLNAHSTHPDKSDEPIEPCFIELAEDQSVAGPFNSAASTAMATFSLGKRSRE
ncbi:hypothetical protein BJ138DRAFT_1106029 [Hygrophoropsis aurantiaca]|uniref:Uncharacterized protein n=1 Tax=Hygrophoropsis aurantiaca TaxID=72124 RepID=A0ACB7ZYF8_9AGAM|nr:hypothetical protein BJ138DRAFT_1106029 [Hygrophoropsis aurantiaca]